MKALSPKNMSYKVTTTKSTGCVLFLWIPLSLLIFVSFKKKRITQCCWIFLLVNHYVFPLKNGRLSKPRTFLSLIDVRQGWCIATERRRAVGWKGKLRIVIAPYRTCVCVFSTTKNPEGNLRKCCLLCLGILEGIPLLFTIIWGDHWAVWLL